MSPLRSLRRAPLLALFFLGMPLLSACSAGGSGGDADCPAASDRSTYPGGPYGVEDGAILEGHTFLDATGAQFGLPALFADEHNRLLLLSTGAGWCTACIEEQPAIEALYQEYKDAGFVVMVTLFEDSQFQPATPALAESWIADNNVTFPVVADPEFQMDAYYDSSLTPMNMLVDLDTMEILRIATGYDESTILATIDALLCEQ